MLFGFDGSEPPLEHHPVTVNLHYFFHTSQPKEMTLISQPVVQTPHNSQQMKRTLLASFLFICGVRTL